MKQCYPSYGRFGLNRIEKALPDSEAAIIEQFLSYCAISAGDNKLKDIKRSILQFRDIVEKNLSEVQLDDLRNFLSLLNRSTRTEYTRNGIKAHVRKLLRWQFQDWSQRFEEFEDVKFKKGFNEEKINEGTLLKTEQIESIIKREKDFVRKAFFLTLYESGLRPKELRILKWKKVRLDSGEGLSELHVFATKTTRARTVFVKEATFYLKRLFENRDSDFVFPSPEDKNEPLPKATAFRWIKEMGDAAGVKIFPYLLRHTRAHELYSRMPSKVAQRFMGHGSDMSDLYAHISSNDIRDSVLKTVYSLQEIPEERRHKLEIEVKTLRREIDLIRQHFPLISRILTKSPSRHDLKAALKRKNPELGSL